jgi:hypothetical protein
MKAAKKTTVRKMDLPNGKGIPVTISSDPKREGMLVGHYTTNIARVLFGKKWQEKLNAAMANQE